MLDIESAREALNTRKEELTARQERVSRHTRDREDPLPQDFAEQILVPVLADVSQQLDRSRVDEGEFICNLFSLLTHCCFHRVPKSVPPIEIVIKHIFPVNRETAEVLKLVSTLTPQCSCSTMLFGKPIHEPAILSNGVGGMA